MVRPDAVGPSVGGFGAVPPGPIPSVHGSLAVAVADSVDDLVELLELLLLMVREEQLLAGTLILQAGDAEAQSRSGPPERLCHWRKTRSAVCHSRLVTFVPSASVSLRVTVRKSPYRSFSVIVLALSRSRRSRWATSSTCSISTLSRTSQSATSVAKVCSLERLLHWRSGSTSRSSWPWASCSSSSAPLPTIRLELGRRFGGEAARSSRCPAECRAFSVTLPTPQIRPTGSGSSVSWPGSPR